MKTAADRARKRERPAPPLLGWLERAGRGVSHPIQGRCIHPARATGDDSFIPHIGEFRQQKNCDGERESGMKRRYTKDEDGVFRDRDGNVFLFGVGEVVGVTVDEPRGGVRGGVVPSLSKTAEQQQHPPAPQRDDRIDRVWAAYVRIHQPRATEAGPQERKLIADALKVATEAEIIEAIEGNKRSDFHQGENDRRKKYNRLSQIIKGRQGKETTRERLDYFIDIARTGGDSHTELTSEEKFKIASLKDRVRRGNGDEDGKRAQAELWERFEISTRWAQVERRGALVSVPSFSDDTAASA